MESGEQADTSGTYQCLGRVNYCQFSQDALLSRTSGCTHGLELRDQYGRGVLRTEQIVRVRRVPLPASIITREQEWARQEK